MLRARRAASAAHLRPPTRRHERSRLSLSRQPCWTAEVALLLLRSRRAVLSFSSVSGAAPRRVQLQWLRRMSDCGHLSQPHLIRPGLTDCLNPAERLPLAANSS
eukprot:COSAG03_NODE_1162_length_4683_cov_24.182810_2_plen_104_part_00